MRFALFTQKTDRTNATGVPKNHRSQLLMQLKEQLPFLAAFIQVSFQFVCSVGRYGEKFAAQLAETNNNVYYFTNDHKEYQITGNTHTIEAKEESIVSLLEAMAEEATKFHCTLRKWQIIAV